MVRTVFALPSGFSCHGFFRFKPLGLYFFGVSIILNLKDFVWV